MAKATVLNNSLLDVTSARQVPFGILQYIQCMHYGLTFVLLYVTFLFTDNSKCRFAVAHDGFPTSVTGIIYIFHSDWIECRGTSHTFLHLYHWLNIVEKEA